MSSPESREQLPAKLAVGDQLRLVVPEDSICFFGERVFGVGMTDSFGRTHWAKKRRLHQSTKKWIGELQQEKAAGKSFEDLGVEYGRRSGFGKSRPLPSKT